MSTEWPLTPLLSLHPLQLLYNDLSPMESHHCTAAWAVLTSNENDFLKALPAKVCLFIVKNHA